MMPNLRCRVPALVPITGWTLRMEGPQFEKKCPVCGLALVLRLGRFRGIVVNHSGTRGP